VSKLKKCPNFGALRTVLLFIWKGLLLTGFLLNISFLDYSSCGSYSFLYLSGSVVDPDPHHFGKPDPDPHQSEKLDLDSDPHQSEKQDPNPHQSETVKRQNSRGGSY
jgi:hypothetical protein